MGAHKELDTIERLLLSLYYIVKLYGRKNFYLSYCSVSGT